MAKEAGFEVNSMIFERRLGMKPEGLYEIESIGEEVKLRRVCDYEGESFACVIAFEALLMDWALYKGEAPLQLPKDVATKSSVVRL